MSRFAEWNGRDADGADAEQIESGRSDDGAGSQLAGLEISTHHLDDAEKNLRRRRAQRHQRQIGNGVVPNPHFNHLRFFVVSTWQIHLIIIIINYYSLKKMNKQTNNRCYVELVELIRDRRSELNEIKRKFCWNQVVFTVDGA